MKTQLIAVLFFFVIFGVGSAVLPHLFEGKALDSAITWVLAFICARTYARCVG